MVQLIPTAVSLTKHAIMRTISVLCVVGVIALIGLGIKRIIYPPKTENYSQVVQAGGTNFNIEVYNPEDTLFLGIKLFGLKFGLSKPTVKKISEISQEVKLPETKVTEVKVTEVKK